jgi:MFS family permease
LMGAGTGIAFPSLMTLAMSGTSPEETGIASGLVNTSLQVGGALGLAVLATLAANRTNGLLATGTPATEALNRGYHLAYLVGAGLVVAALAVTVVAFRSQASAEPAPTQVVEPDQPAAAPNQPTCGHCLLSGRVATTTATVRGG